MGVGSVGDEVFVAAKLANLRRGEIAGLAGQLEGSGGPGWVGTPVTHICGSSAGGWPGDGPARLYPAGPEVVDPAPAPPRASH